MNLHGHSRASPKALATAAVDQLLHHAHIVLPEGSSLRLTQATSSQSVVPLARHERRTTRTQDGTSAPAARLAMSCRNSSNRRKNVSSSRLARKMPLDGTGPAQSHWQAVLPAQPRRERSVRGVEGELLIYSVDLQGDGVAEQHHAQLHPPRTHIKGRSRTCSTNSKASRHSTIGRGRSSRSSGTRSPYAERLCGDRTGLCLAHRNQKHRFHDREALGDVPAHDSDSHA